MRRLLLLAALLIAAVAIGAGAYLWREHAQASAASQAGLDVGRGVDDVMLTSMTGQELRWADLQRRPQAVFFGFTQCPMICPVTVYELGASLERIGAEPGAMQLTFITVDPERDTLESMRRYFESFGPYVVGYTGAPESLARMQQAFEIVAERRETPDGSYTYDHTATVFLLNAEGEAVDVVAFGAEPELIDQRLGALLDLN